LWESDFNISVTCLDNHLQTLTKSKIISIDADPTITNPQPKGGTYMPGDEVEISIETQRDATCYFLDNDHNYVPLEEPSTLPPNFQLSDWTIFDETGEQFHSSIRDDNESGIFIYFTMCDIDGDYYFGNYADVPYFGRDGEAPILRTLDEATYELYDPEGPPVDQLTLIFECNDSSIFFQGQDYSFGCNELLYCEHITNEPRCTPDEEPSSAGNNVWEQTFYTPNAGYQTSIVLLIDDVGGNERTYNLDLKTLRNTSFFEPEIIICDPARGIPCE